MILRGVGMVVRYTGAGRAAVDGVGLCLSAGELVAVVGPNGSGKSTLLRALLGRQPLAAGSVEIEGRPAAAWSPRELARLVGVVVQREESLFPLTVRETVALGRYAHLGPLGAERPADRLAVAEAMERADVARFAERRTDTLSGGEWQRTRIARALAQEPRALVLDEPTASLDVRHEMEVFELVSRLTRAGTAALIVTHHLNLAARYAQRMVLLDNGGVAAQGTPQEVLRSEVVERVFGWPVAITTWCDGAPQVVPLRPAEVGS